MTRTPPQTWAAVTGWPSNTVMMAVKTAIRFR
jgi:hypothetical protein